MAHTSTEQLQVAVKLSVSQGNEDLPGTFGKGTVSLLQGVEERGSLNQAAKMMNMAYSKAWRLVKEAEKHVGTDLIHRHGAHGSELTDEGKKLLDTYLVVEKEITELASRRFKELIDAE